MLGSINFAAFETTMDWMENGQEIGWKQAWQSNRFKSLFISGAVGLLVTVVIWPIFLGHIERRNGTVLHDALLVLLPVKDLSIPIFACLWSAAFIMLVRVLRQPKLFLMFLYSYWLLFILRMLTIQLFPLNPPIGLINLKDPISNLFYGNGGLFITKDLFFSGHTASLFLMFFYLEKKWEKLFALFAAIAVGIMVLFQHIHYSIDVIFAPVFAFVLYWVVKKWLGDIIYQNKSVVVWKRKRLVN